MGAEDTHGADLHGQVLDIQVLFSILLAFGLRVLGSHQKQDVPSTLEQGFA